MKQRKNYSVIFTFLIVILTTGLFAQVPNTAKELGFSNGFPPSRTVDMSKWDKGEDCRCGS